MVQSPGVWIFETFQRLYNARGEAERIIQPLESFKNPHPLPNDREGGQHGLQCFCKAPQVVPACLLACGMNLNSAGVWIFKLSRGCIIREAKPIALYSLSKVSKIHIPCPMTGRADSMVFSAFGKVRNFELGPHADQSDEMYQYFYRYLRGRS